MHSHPLVVVVLASCMNSLQSITAASAFPESLDLNARVEDATWQSPVPMHFTTDSPETRFDKALPRDIIQPRSTLEIPDSLREPQTQDADHHTNGHPLAADGVSVQDASEHTQTTGKPSTAVPGAGSSNKMDEKCVLHTSKCDSRSMITPRQALSREDKSTEETREDTYLRSARDADDHWSGIRRRHVEEITNANNPRFDHAHVVRFDKGDLRRMENKWRAGIH